MREAYTMRGKKPFTVTAGLVLIALLATVAYHSASSREAQEIPAGEVFISNYTGYVAGYVNETIVLTVYWLKTGNVDFSGTIGVRNLPPCVEAGGIDLSTDSTSSRVKRATISVALRLKKAGRCVMDNAYLEVRQDNLIRKVSLGSVEFEVMKPPEEKVLRVPSAVEASIGPKPSIPRLMYTISNPLNETVEIINVSFSVPGLKVSSFGPRVIAPGETVNFTVTTTNTSELNDLYVIKPLIVYRIGDETRVMPLGAFYYATLPDEERLVEMIKSRAD